MRVILGDRGGQRGGGGVGFLRFLGVDHRDQQVVELREVLVQFVGLLPPRQRLGEHQVGVGADAEVGDREPGGEHGKQQSAERHGKRVALAEIGQSDNQAVQHRPGRITSRRPASAGGV